MRHRLDPVLCFGALAVALLSGPVGVARAAGVQIISEQRTAPRVVLLTISTPAFTIPTKVDVDLPVGYDADPHRRWPVTYILAGTMNTYATFNGFVNGVKLAEPFHGRRRRALANARRRHDREVAGAVAGSETALGRKRARGPAISMPTQSRLPPGRCSVRQSA